MKIEDWFDPENIEHVKAYDELQQRGIWPKGFLPEDIEMGNCWQVLLMSKLADKYIESKLKDGIAHMRGCETCGSPNECMGWGMCINKETKKTFGKHRD